MANYRYKVKITCDYEGDAFPYNAIELAQSWYNEEQVPVGSEEYEMFANQIDPEGYHDGKAFCFTVDGCGPNDTNQMKNSLDHSAEWLMEQYDKVKQVDVSWTRITDVPDGSHTVVRK